MNTHVFGAGDPGAKARREARQQAVRAAKDKAAAEKKAS
jgi:uncharacterized protein YggE